MRCAVMIVAYEAVGLQAVYEFVLFVELPVKRDGVFLVVPHSVKPDGPYGAVVSEQFCELSVHEPVI